MLNLFLKQDTKYCKKILLLDDIQGKISVKKKRNNKNAEPYSPKLVELVQIFVKVLPITEYLVDLLKKKKLNKN